MKRSLTTAVQLPAKVISVGNLTMGGTGKTPFVLMLARRFDAGILTRGYRRRSNVELILEPGAAAPVDWTGDEPQILLREGVAPVGVGADRVSAGRRLIERFGSKRIILDDGFQHARLARQVDLVLVDALDPFGNGHVFPLGRLREPISALRRATLIVITRSEGPQPGLEAVLREHNPSAPIFTSRVVPLHWVRATTGERLELTVILATPTAAFCGLGNPASFWRTLAQLGIKPALSREFPDHHRYTARDMQPFAGYGQVLTTEKDAVNLPAPPANVYWLKIAVQIDRESEFWEEMERQLTR